MWPRGGGFGQPTGFGQQVQQQVPPAAAGFPPAVFGQPPAIGFQSPAQQQPGFGQSPIGVDQQQPPATGGFAQFGQTAGGGFGGFGQQRQEAQAVPGGGFAFGQQVQLPAAAQPAPASGFAFGQQQQQQQQQQPGPVSTFTFGQQQQQTTPGGFTFGQQSPAQPPVQQPASSRFTFGQKAGSAAGQPAAGPAQQAEQQGAQGGSGVKFGFVSAQRKKQQARAPAAAFAEDEGDEMDEAGIAAARAAALASLPKFQAAGGGGKPPTRAPAVPPPPPPKAPRRAGAGVAEGLDAEEVARRAQRASRFSGPPAAPVAAPEPTPAAPPVAMRRPTSAASGMPLGEGVMGGGFDAGEGDADAEGEGGVRAGAIVGTCEEMCPAPERERRSRLSDIQIFERTDEANSALTSPELAVKRFARTVDESNNAPEYFRTRGALTRTMQHLRNLLDRQDARLGLIHKFLWDRYRSVRQDLYIQGMDDEFSVGIYEEVVRFHVLSEHELCEEEASITEMEGFNSHLNMEQMNKSLISLNDMYNKLAAAGRPVQSEAEFRAYHLLSLMGQHGKFKGDQQGFLSMLQAMRPEVRGSGPIQWVLKLQRALAANNFVRFFALVRQAPYLLACLSHIYFGQVRGRALRALSDTLAPKAGTPAVVELEWLVTALMLDSGAQAQQLCALHGYETSIQDGVPVALLVKGTYVDPPPPVPRKRSELISHMAPPTRSLAVTTPALPPMSAEEAAHLEQQRQKQLQRFREEEAQRAQQVAQQRHLYEAAAAAAAAAAEKRRQEEESARLAEQARLHEQELARQREAQLAEQQRQQAVLQQQQQAEQLRREEEARRQQQLAKMRRQQEEQQRAAAEAERRRRESEEAERRRQQAAEEAERRRLAELERRRLEELRRQEEERRARREAKRHRAIQIFYLARWRVETHRRISERERQRRLAINLKACRVGMASKVAQAEAEMAFELEELHIDGDKDASADRPRQHDGGAAAAATAAAAAAAAAREALDLPALAAPLLLRCSPAARNLYWKVLLAPVAWFASSRSSGQAEWQQVQHLHSWMALQLQRGRPIQLGGTGSVHVEGPLPLHVPLGSDGSGAVAELTVCLATPGASNSSSTAALAGTSAVVMAVPSTATAATQRVQAIGLSILSSLSAPVPTLLIAPNDVAAQQWQQDIDAGSLSFPGPALVVSVQQDAVPANDPAQPGLGSLHSTPPGAAAPAAYSRQRLAQGLRWLAAHAPQQPVLKVVPPEVLARDAFAATSMPMLQLPAAATGGMPAAQLLCTALQQALDLVSQAAERACSSAAAAWRWPPPELAPLRLKSWHDCTSLPALKNALQRLRPDPAHLLRIAEGGTLQALRVAAHLHLAALEAEHLAPLVLPLEVEKWLEQQMEAAEAAPPPALPPALLVAARRQQQQQHRCSAPSVLQKRKWQAGSPPTAAAGTPAGVGMSRSWAAVVAGSTAGLACSAAPQQLTVTPQQPAAAAISRLALWQHLKQQLQDEQQREQGLQEHVAMEATGGLSGERPVWVGSSSSSLGDDVSNGNFAAAHEETAVGPDKLSLLQRLRKEAMAERAAADRLVDFALL